MALVEFDDGGLLLSALLATLIVGLLTYIFSKHFFTNTIPLEAVGGEAQDKHVVNQDNLDLITTEEKVTTNQYVKLLTNLEIRILAINQLIDDAEDNQTPNLAPRLKQWVDDLKQVVYDAEDVRDVIATQTRENELSTTTTPWNPFGRPLHEELDDVLYRMKCLLKQKKVFGLKPSTRSNSTIPETSMRLPTTSLVDQSGVYGRDHDKEKIKTLLLSNHGSSNVDVIAIVGMGGLGKTTLAQFLFTHYQIDSVFKPNKAWISVGEDFDVIKMTRIILERLTSQSHATNDLDILQTKLKETLSGKKFLIVLDDVWDENDANWDCLQKPFDVAAQGSKIIVTTRTERVASVTRATSIYKLKPLSYEACWKLFSKHAFENMQPNVNSTFEANVVKKCGGIPLAAKVLGGLLRKRDRKEWDEILRSNVWKLPNEVLPVLRLSYHYLPSNLKRCFAFCSLVPKDFDFEREKLVLLWMAENLLQDSESTRRIDIGYEYLCDLESRSLIQPSIDDHKCFGMHDLVNDLAKSVSGKLYKNFDLEKSFKVGQKTRHFSYAVTSDDFKDSATRFKGISESKQLKTFLPLLPQGTNIGLPHILCSEIWPQLNVLRSLTLARAGIEQLSDSIENLKLLRYLDLSNNEKLIELPESVASLYNLEVLNLDGCKSLTKLPSKLRQLVELNYLNIRETKLQEMPLQMGRLKDLDVLTYFVVGKDSGSSIRELKELKYLRGELSIRGLQNISNPEDALEANMKEKSLLEELTLEWEYIDSDKSSEDAITILENLRPPYVKLTKLCMKKYSGTRLPDWSGDHSSFVNLVDIQIIDFENCFDLSPLGQLPSLKSLYISKCDSLVTLIIPVELPKEIHHHIHFSALVRLEIYGCPMLELPQQHHRFISIDYFSLNFGSCASLRLFPLSLFPKLRDLKLRDLESIESLGVIDEANNLNLQYLEFIEISNCPKLEYLDSLVTLIIPVELPKEIHHHIHFSALVELKIYGCPKLELPQQHHLFTSIEYFSLMGGSCASLRLFPLTLFPKLRKLGLYNVLSIESLGVIDEANTLNLQYLECIHIWECPKFEYLDAGKWCAPKMTKLRLNRCESLKVLPENMCNIFPSLSDLYLWECPKLQCLPQLPTSLYILSIYNCRMLNSRCQREQGEDWSKIARIPKIIVSWEIA